MISIWESPLGIQEVEQESARVRNNLRNIHIRRELFYSLFLIRTFFIRMLRVIFDQPYKEMCGRK